MLQVEEKTFLQDITKLKSSLLAFSRKMLDQHGEFHPFARAIKMDGVLVAYGIALDNMHASSQDSLSFLKKSLSAAAKQRQVRAVGLCCNMKRVDGDKVMCAIQIFLEYQNGAAIEILTPYEVDSLGKCKLLNEQMRQGEASVF